MFRKKAKLNLKRDTGRVGKVGSKRSFGSSIIKFMTNAMMNSAVRSFILSRGEPLFISADNRLFIGDGVTPVKDLSPIGSHLLQELLERLYPVGTIYSTVDSGFDPNDNFAGSWIKLESNRVLWSSDTGGTKLSQQLPTLPAIQGNYAEVHLYKYGGTQSVQALAVPDAEIHYPAAFVSGLPGEKHTHSYAASSVYSGSVVRPNAYTCIFWQRIS